MVDLYQMQFIWKGVFLNPFNKDLSLSKMSFYSPLKHPLQVKIKFKLIFLTQGCQK